MRSRISALPLLIALMLSVVLAACGGTAPTTPAVTAPPAKVKTALSQHRARDDEQDKQHPFAGLHGLATLSDADCTLAVSLLFSSSNSRKASRYRGASSRACNTCRFAAGSRARYSRRARR